jgi:hypothetical protein
MKNEGTKAEQLSRIAVALVREKLGDSKLPEEGSQFISREIGEWTRIARQHPIQCALAAGGIALAVRLRARPGVLRVFLKSAAKMVPEFTEMVTADVSSAVDERVSAGKKARGQRGRGRARAA